MRKSYLATAAAAALIVAGAAHAQSPGSMEKKEMPGASGTPSTPASPAPSTTKQREPSGTVGQSAPTKSAPSTGATTGTKADTKSGDSKMGADTKSGADVKSGTSAQSPADSKSGKSAQSPDTKSGTTTKSSDTKSGSATTGQAASGSINLTAQQKTEIRQKVLVSAPRVQNVNFSLSVGTVVPRTVTLAAVPETLIVIHPQWRGYRYFVVRDEIVIVEPDTLKIVAVIVV